MSDDNSAAPRPLGVGALVGLGVAVALVGLVPWLITGMRLPLQNLWADQTSPEEMPRVLLPLNQYAITLVLALIVTPYGVVAVAVRALGPRRGARAGLAAAAGVLLVQLVATVQSTTVVASGLSRRDASTLYLGALVVLQVVAVLLGLLVLRLVVARSRAGAVIGLTFLGLALGSWLAAVVAPFGGIPEGTGWAATTAVRWVPALVVGASIGWAGLGSPGRVAAAVGAFLPLWVGPALVTAVTNAAGFRLLLPYPAELLDYGLQVLRAALGQPALVVPPLLLAGVTAGVVGVVLRLRGQNRPGRPLRNR